MERESQEDPDEASLDNKLALISALLVMLPDEERDKLLSKIDPERRELLAAFERRLEIHDETPASSENDTRFEEAKEVTFRTLSQFQAERTGRRRFEFVDRMATKIAIGFRNFHSHLPFRH